MISFCVLVLLSVCMHLLLTLTACYSCPFLCIIYQLVGFTWCSFA
jgi:hypothetical protein